MVVAMLNHIGSPATLHVRAGVTRDEFDNDVPIFADVDLDNVFVYTGDGDTTGRVGGYLEVDSDATALLPMGTAARLDVLVGGHSLAGATLEQGDAPYEVQGSPLPYPDGTSPYSWEWAVRLKAVTG